MRSYETSRGILGLIEFLCWVGIALGIIAALLAGSAAAKFSGYGAPSFFAVALPGIVLASLGLIGVVQCQMARAGVDTAELTGQVLKVARDQLDVSKQALRQGRSLEQGFSALAASTKAESELTSQSKGYEDLATKQPEMPMEALPSASDEVSQNTLEKTITVDGFVQLNDAATEFEYRGQVLRLVDGKYDLNGIGFASAKQAKTYINQLKIPV